LASERPVARARRRWRIFIFVSFSNVKVTLFFHILIYKSKKKVKRWGGR
jgi:hypothetical protein